MDLLNPTIAEIDLDCLAFNLSQIKKILFPSKKLLTVVKANAYGHGYVEVAKRALKEGADMLGVVSLKEAQVLRKAGIREQILVLGSVFEEEIPEAVGLGITPVIFSLPILAKLNSEAKKQNKKVNFHLEIETGMGRLGIKTQEIEPFLKEIGRSGNLILEGVMTHFAQAEVEDKSYTLCQIEIFKKAVEIIKNSHKEILVHCANSAALLEFPEVYYDLVRVGIMMYGYCPHKRLKNKIQLKPVMTLKTKVMHIKTLEQGKSVSYGRRFFTPRESKIATIFSGYGDGISRRMTNLGEVLVRGKRAPIAGTVCMDQFMADVTDIPGVEAGDEVVLIGRQGNEFIGADEVAEKLDTIPYEILCAVSGRVDRVYISHLDSAR